MKIKIMILMMVVGFSVSSQEVTSVLEERYPLTYERQKLTVLGFWIVTDATPILNMSVSTTFAGQTNFYVSAEENSGTGVILHQQLSGDNVEMTVIVPDNIVGDTVYAIIYTQEYLTAGDEITTTLNGVSTLVHVEENSLPEWVGEKTIYLDPGEELEYYTFFQIEDADSMAPRGYQYFWLDTIVTPPGSEWIGRGGGLVHMGDNPPVKSQFHGYWSWTAPEEPGVFDLILEAHDGIDSVRFELKVVVEADTLFVPEDTVTVPEDTVSLYSPPALEREIELVVYPNPVTEILYIKNVSGVTRIKVFNSNGVKLYNDLYSPSGINVSDYPAGVYYVKINNEKIKKVIKN